VIFVPVVDEVGVAGGDINEKIALNRHVSIQFLMLNLKKLVTKACNYFK
jgi:hypothetical protein